MAGYIIHGQEPDVVIAPTDADALLSLSATDNGDAILLYLALRRSKGPVSQNYLQEKLGFTAQQLDKYEAALKDLGLLANPVQKPIPQPAEQWRGKTYSPMEMSAILKTDKSFAELLKLVEQKLNKRFDVPEMSKLASIYRDAGLPADVIYLLVCYCTEQIRAKFGPYRSPSIYQIEKAAWKMARAGVKDYDEAEKYIKNAGKLQALIAKYKEALGISGRKTVPSEDTYLNAWASHGFHASAIALAYDKTMMNKHSLHWGYMSAILNRWLDRGWLDAQAVLEGEKPHSGTAAAGTGTSNRGKSGYGQQQDRDGAEWMLKYMRRLDGDSGEEGQ